MAAAQPIVPPDFRQVLLFANGDLNDGVAVRQALQMPNATVVAADGGADMALRLGLIPTLTIGDMDSISPAAMAQLQQSGAEILHFPAEKDETDLELALLAAAARGATWIRMIGAMGGRLDQTLANTYLLTLPALRTVDVRMVAGAQTIWLLHPGDHPLMGSVGDTISLLPLSQDVRAVKSTHLQYPLQQETLIFGPARGISNVVAQPNPRLAFEEGLLLVVHTLGRA